MLPFTPAQFHHLFALYNTDIWPVQLVAYALGVLATGMLLRPGAAADRAIAVVLAAMWIWTGVAYHWVFFSTINLAAYAFGALFVVQGLVLLWAGLRGGLRFGHEHVLRSTLGAAFIVYAMIAYPLLGVAFGHRYPGIPMFGVTPCPVAIFTFGCLLWLRSPLTWWLAAIALLWSLIGGTAAFLLEVPQDWLLLGSGVVTVALRATTRPQTTEK